MGMPDTDRRSWKKKFSDAAHGIGASFRSEASFRVHLPCAAVVLSAAALLRLKPGDWSLILLCVVLVISAEIFNTALESLAKVLDSEFNPHLKSALDAGSGAVLCTAIGAVLVGMVVFGNRAGQLLNWW